MSTDVTFVSAVMESSRIASRHAARGKLIACRMPDLNIQVNMVPAKIGWEAVAIN